ncbi:MAG TPA: DegV family protein [Candidatus Scatavimonas merdigallinarum]|uniref:DegV family protein n=1 Tax=Candidatus Scatavimonas merdigallinarum TaxID=2840914 RepID=A0A9D1CV86_9FIRM|nr:DegV family protein [Candidatus Scatavimonas merdigallinarum]
MENYVLISDCTLDLPAQHCSELDIHVIPMEFTLDGRPFKHYIDARQLSYQAFYQAMRTGRFSTTSQINYKEFSSFFQPFLESGKDILYICFTSGMSGTYNTCRIAVADLQKKYPDRKIVIVDSLCASVGEGLLVYHAGLKKRAGMQLSALADWVEQNKQRVCHWFVVDDLEHLKRGGRIGTVTAAFGKALQIKPLLSVDSDGKLTTVAKIRGASKVLEGLADRLISDGANTKEQTVIIGHADVLEDAQALDRLLKERGLIKDSIIADIGPVIGTHVGAGMLALTFMGERRMK